MQRNHFEVKKIPLNQKISSNIMEVRQDSRVIQYFFLILGIALTIHLICISSIKLLVQEAYYWNYAQHLDFSYLDHPPMVALLIKLSTTIFGTSEFGVRAISLFCSILVALFSYKLTQLIDKGSGIYAMILLVVLPFYFLHSQIITPDVPLLICWSASLYSLYRSLILSEANYWYLAGLWLGLGMLSKYTIALLGISTFMYLIIEPTARPWLRRKEPYLGAIITLLIFTPVIYWNATHQWVSFIFQSSRRMTSTSSITLHQLIGVALLFLMPIGMYGLWELMKKNNSVVPHIHSNVKLFIRVFTLVPLGVFALFSLSHTIKFNWIGPIFLVLIPWLAALIAHNPKTRLSWVKSCVLLLGCYSAMILMAYFNKSETIQRKLFNSFIDWNNFTRQFNDLATQIAVKTNKVPIFVPLDNYHIGSELSFYQTKLKSIGKVITNYPVAGSHIFGNNSLMYRYWSNRIDYLNKPLILISAQLNSFDNNLLKEQILEQSKIKKIASIGQGQGTRSNTYYYKVVTIKG